MIKQALDEFGLMILAVVIMTIAFAPMLQFFCFWLRIYVTMMEAILLWFAIGTTLSIIATIVIYIKAKITTKDTK